MRERPTWSIIIPSIFLIYLGFALGGFFIVNYFIGVAGILLGLYNLLEGKMKKKCILCGCPDHWLVGCADHRVGKHKHKKK